MTNIVIDKEFTCAVTGHRIMKKNFDNDELYKVFNSLIDSKVDTFLIGMAIGFDSLCFRILEDIRKNIKIKIIACVPCFEQEKNFNLSNKTEYYDMLNSADSVIYVSDDYFVGCMQKRNRFMCDNANYLVSYIRRENGGTFSTVKYAEKKGLKILKV